MALQPAFAPWSVRAVNLPEHGDNTIHTDEGAIAAGFRRALVAGTTVYAYLTHPPAAVWGRSWIDGGGSEVRFLAPICDDDLVQLRTVEPSPRANKCVEATVEALVDSEVRATFDVWQTAEPPPAPRGELLPSTSFDLGPPMGNYGRRCGDDLSIYDEESVVHPVCWPIIGNQVTKANFVTGPWIHVRSRILHLGPAVSGTPAVAESRLLDRFATRAGERVLIDVRVSIDGRPVAAIEHESIIDLAPSPE